MNRMQRKKKIKTAAESRIKLKFFLFCLSTAKTQPTKIACKK